MRLNALIASAALTLTLAAPAIAQETVAITGGRVLTGTSVIEMSSPTRMVTAMAGPNAWKHCSSATSSTADAAATVMPAAKMIGVYDPTEATIASLTLPRFLRSSAPKPTT